MNMGLTGREFRDHLRRGYSEIVGWMRIARIVQYIQRNRINVLVYHNIAFERNPFMVGVPNVAPEVFEAQIRFLAEHYNVISVKDLVKSLNSGIFPQRGVVITFDDAYRGVLENAVPILHKYSVPATIFLITDLLDNRKLSWRNKLEFILAQEQGAHFIKILKEFYSPEETTCLEPHNLKLWTIHHFAQGILNRAFDQLFTRLGWDEITLAQGAQLYFDFSDLSRVDKELIEFGNHTRSHPVLSRLTLEQQQEEIIGAYSCLEHHLGYRSFPFAYPFGTSAAYAAETQQIVRHSGHSCAFNVSEAAISSRSLSVFDLPRKAAPELRLPMFRDFLENTLPMQSVFRLMRLFSPLNGPRERIDNDG